MAKMDQINDKVLKELPTLIPEIKCRIFREFTSYSEINDLETKIKAVHIKETAKDLIHLLHQCVDILDFTGAPLTKNYQINIVNEFSPILYKQIASFPFLKEFRAIVNGVYLKAEELIALTRNVHGRYLEIGISTQPKFMKKLIDNPKIREESLLNEFGAKLIQLFIEGYNIRSEAYGADFVFGFINVLFYKKDMLSLTVGDSLELPKIIPKYKEFFAALPITTLVIDVAYIRNEEFFKIFEVFPQVTTLVFITDDYEYIHPDNILDETVVNQITKFKWIVLNPTLHGLDEYYVPEVNITSEQITEFDFPIYVSDIEGWKTELPNVKHFTFVENIRIKMYKELIEANKSDLIMHGYPPEDV